MAAVDWKAVSREYIEGFVVDGVLKYPTVRDLAAKYNLNVSTVGRHCSKEEWNIQRERFANKVVDDCKQKKAEALSDEMAKYDLQCLSISHNGIRQVERMIAEGLNVGELATAARALKDFQTVGKNAIGEDGNANGDVVIKVRLTDGD